MSELPTPGSIQPRKRNDGGSRLAIGIVAIALLVIGALLYAFHGGSTKSTMHSSAETSGRNAPAPYPVVPPPSKHETRETAPTMPPHGP
jgi:hypothetical protein